MSARIWGRIVVGLALLAAFVFFLIVPPAVEWWMNPVLARGPHAVSAPARELHRRLAVADLHADSLLWGRDLLARGWRGHVDLPRLVEGNVALQVFTIVTKSPRGLNYERNDGDTDNITSLAIAQRYPPRAWTSLAQRALYQASRLTEAAGHSGGRLVLVRSAHDLREFLARRLAEPGITAAILGVEGAHALDGDVANVDRFYRAGIRMMSPAHFFDNEMAGSVHGIGKGGLTDRGRQMVRRMNELGMIIDLAHVSEQTFDEVLEISNRAVVVSHTGVKGTCDNIRNLSDRQLRALAQQGAVIGIGFWDTATCGDDAGAIARAIRHAADVAGIEHVALGSDFDGSVAVPFDASGMVVLTDALLAEGFDEREVTAIMGGNVMRFLLANLP